MSAASPGAGPSAPFRSAWLRASVYLELIKPRVLPLVLLTGLPALLLAQTDWPAPLRAGLVLLGIALAAAAANVLNMYIERERDKLMTRTRGRPLPSGRLAPAAALAFGVALGVAATLLLGFVSGAAAALLSLASILFYVFVYTVWLKPRTVYHVVIGGAAGAAAPLIADVAMNGSLGLPGLVLFAIVFLWQPPHVLAIALYRGDEYEAAGIPTLPAAIGPARTRRRMLLYTAGLVPMSFAPWLLGWVGPLYASVALLLNGWFVFSQLRLLHARDAAAARRVFQVSLIYLFLLYLAMIVDRIVAHSA